MKTSNVFLTLALTLPVLASALGVAAGLPSAKDAGSGSGGFSQRIGHLLKVDGGPYVTVYDGTTPISDDLTLKVDASRLDLAFDPDLKNVAKIKVEAKQKEDANFSLQKDGFWFRPRDHAHGLRVSVTLPSQMASLDLTLNAGRCSVDAKVPVILNNFSIALDAGSCDLSYKQLTSKKLHITVNAGKLAFDAARLKSSFIDASVNAGKLGFDAGSVAIPASGPRELHFSNAAGNSDIALHGLPEHGIVAKTSMGQLTLEHGKEVERLQGLGQNRTITASAGSPTVYLDVSMGKMDAHID